MSVWVERHRDSEEVVRREVIKLVTLLLENINTYPYLPESSYVSICDILKERILDKKWTVRKVAMTSASMIHMRLCSAPEEAGAAAKNVLEYMSWVLEKFLHQFYQPSQQDKFHVTSLIVRYMFPIDSAHRFSALINAFKYCNENAKLALNEIVRRKFDLNEPLRIVLDSKSDPIERENNLKLVSRYIQEGNSLELFLEVAEKDKKIAKHLKELLKSNLSFEASITARDNLLSALGTDHPSYLSIHSAIDTAFTQLVDKGGITMMLSQAKHDLEIDDNEESCDTILNLILIFIKNDPSLLIHQDSLEELNILSKVDKIDIATRALEILSYTSGALKSVPPQLAYSIQNSMIKLCSEGSPNQAKFAVYYIHRAVKDPEQVLQRILTKIKDKSLNFEEKDRLQTSVTVLGLIALLQPTLITNRIAKDVISKFLIREIITKDWSSSGAPQKAKKSRHWEEVHKLSIEIQIKLRTLKAVTRWLVGCQNREESGTSAVIRLLSDIIVKEGDLQEQGMISNAEKSHMRLKAATCLLKLGELPYCRGIKYYNLLASN